MAVTRDDQNRRRQPAVDAYSEPSLSIDSASLLLLLLGSECTSSRSPRGRFRARPAVPAALACEAVSARCVGLCRGSLVGR
jgi:hypothetical protein